MFSWSETKYLTKVWLLITTSRHGDSATVHSTKEGAWNTLYEYVKEEWDAEVNSRWSSGKDKKVPKDKNKAVTRYFDTVQDEFYTLEELTVDA